MNACCMLDVVRGSGKRVGPRQTSGIEARAPARVYKPANMEGVRKAGAGS